MLATADPTPSMQAADRSASTGFLLIHGVTGAPTEMRPLARHLERVGYRVTVPLLPGHGAGHRQLLATTRHDWLDGVRRPFDDLATTCDQVVVVGLCAGGLLTVLVAAEDRRVAGLVVLAPDLGFRKPGPATPWTRILLPLAYRIPLLRRYGYWTEGPPYGLKDPRLQQLIRRSIAAAKQGQTDEYGTFRTYVCTLYEMDRLQDEVRRRAGAVRCPALVMHSVEDSLFSVRNATLLYRLLGSHEKSITVLTGCDHVMTMDVRREDVARRIAAFARRLAVQSTPR